MCDANDVLREMGVHICTRTMGKELTLGTDPTTRLHRASRSIDSPAGASHRARHEAYGVADSSQAYHEKVYSSSRKLQLVKVTCPLI